jgi:hypothetical protein
MVFGRVHTEPCRNIPDSRYMLGDGRDVELVERMQHFTA